MPLALERPLVFGDVPSVILSRAAVGDFLAFFRARHVRFEAMLFQHDINFHLVRFPLLTAEGVEELLDQLMRHGE
jgi:hypothetical protein